MHEAVKKYLAAIGKRGGKVTSPRKTETAQANGKLGGRPRKNQTPRATMKNVIAITILAVVALAGVQVQAQKECTDHERAQHRKSYCTPEQPLPPAEPVHVMTPAEYTSLDARITELRAAMKDPDSFIVETVYYHFNNPINARETALASRWCGGHSFTEKGTAECIDRKNAETAKVANTVNLCIEYRAKNSYGGYGKDAAIAISNVRYVNTPLQISCGQATQGYWTLVPPAPAPASATPADLAKQAQAYADCLKVAVDNPTVVCKAPQTPAQSK
jgi:hypothetical protein